MRGPTFECDTLALVRLFNFAQHVDSCREEEAAAAVERVLCLPKYGQPAIAGHRQSVSEGPIV